MKRLIAMVLLLCTVMGLFACGNQNEITYTPPVSTEPQDTTPVATEPAPTEPPVAEVKYRHPLDGSPLTEPWTGRASGVALGNTKKAMPQHGLNQAALIYEAEVEGSSTRIMAVFGDTKDVQPVGPIRSARTFFNSICQALDAVIFHAGGSKRGRGGYHDLKGKKISDWDHVNALIGSNNATFYRDKDRRSAGYALEHTMFSDGEKMLAALERREYLNAADAQPSPGFTFVEDFTFTGTPANSVVVKFRAGKTSTFTYDPATGLYSASQYKQDWIDGNTNEVQKFKNIVVLKSKQTVKGDGEYPRSYYNLSGIKDMAGEGWFVLDGQMVPIKWTRDALEDPFTFFLEDGTPVAFEPGRTYTAITSSKEAITCE